MDHLHPVMQQCLGHFTGATMFTVNPAFPHPDQDSDDVQAWPMQEAVAYAIAVLQNPNATQRDRNHAASELDAAWINHEEQ